MLRMLVVPCVGPRQRPQRPLRCHHPSLTTPSMAINRRHNVRHASRVLHPPSHRRIRVFLHRCPPHRRSSAHHVSDRFTRGRGACPQRQGMVGGTPTPLPPHRRPSEDVSCSPTGAEDICVRIPPDATLDARPDDPVGACLGAVLSWQRLRPAAPCDASAPPARRICGGLRLSLGRGLIGALSCCTSNAPPPPPAL